MKVLKFIGFLLLIAVVMFVFCVLSVSLINLLIFLKHEDYNSGIIMRYIANSIEFVLKSSAFWIIGVFAIGRIAKKMIKDK